MREQIDTIPVNEAFSSGDECPFCYLERQAEQRAIRYTVGPGASYMEPEVRGTTDRLGFCDQHMKKLYDYGNALGNALILQTYYVGLIRELDRQLDDFEIPPKKNLFSLKKQESGETENTLLQWAKHRNESCFLCDKIAYNMHRYYTTFFYLVKDAEFRSKVEQCKGFCMRHFTQLMEVAQQELPNAQREWFYATIPSQMRDNLARIQADLDWFIEKFDYRNASADWKNSRDAVPRAMQKLRSGYPSDPPYKEK